MYKTAIDRMLLGGSVVSKARDAIALVWFISIVVKGLLRVQTVWTRRFSGSVVI